MEKEIYLANKPFFLKTSEASKYFNVSQNTIRKWADQGIINVIRSDSSMKAGYGHRIYDVNSYNLNKKSSVAMEINEDDSIKNNVCYCRISSVHQKDDLKRQVDFMRKKYPSYEIIKDIGSGINFKRKGLLKLIKSVINGNIRTIVIAHKDRLARFGFDLFEWLFKEYNVSLIIIDKQSFATPEQELANDLLSITHVFSCKMNGKRRYKSSKSDKSSKSNKL